MYPRQFLDSFWSPALRDEAFVAMSFDDAYASVFDDIIQPASAATGPGTRSATDSLDESELAPAQR